MSLLDKIFHEEMPSANSHLLGSILRTWLNGDRTNAEALAVANTMFTLNNGRDGNGDPIPYALTGSEQTTLLEFRTHYDALGTDTEQLSYLARVEGLLVEAEQGTGAIISRASFKSILGLT